MPYQSVVKVDRAVPLLLARGSTGSIPLLTRWRMAMGTRDPEQPPLWIAASDLPVSPGHPFYTRLNALLDADGFDTFVEDACRFLLRAGVGPPESGARSLRPLVAGWVLRRHRFGINQDFLFNRPGTGGVADPRPRCTGFWTTATLGTLYSKYVQAGGLLILWFSPAGKNRGTA